MTDDSADYNVGMPPAKKQRGIMGEIVALQDDNNTDPLRASSLAAPTMQLSGHTGSVYALEYSPDGSALCSASFDKTCLLWSHGDYTNYNVLAGHKNAVLDVAWVDDDTVASVGADHMVMLWDALTGQRLRKWSTGHTAIVNACAALSEQTVATVGDDGVCCVWDRRQKQVVAQLSAPDANNLPVLAVTGTGTTLYAAGIDPKITAWDLNMQKRLYAMTGHQDTVTSLALHPEGTHVLSNAMDGTLKLWTKRQRMERKVMPKSLAARFLTPLAEWMALMINSFSKFIEN